MGGGGGRLCVFPYPSGPMKSIRAYEIDGMHADASLAQLLVAVARM